MEITKRSLVLTFIGQNGKAAKITVNNPKESLVPIEVKAAMDGVVASNAFGSESAVVGYESAKYHISQVEEIIL
jgi:hypothetical protein